MKGSQRVAEWPQPASPSIQPQAPSHVLAQKFCRQMKGQARALGTLHVRVYLSLSWLGLSEHA